MSEPDSIILAYLRNFDAKLDKFGERIDALTARVSGMEKQMALIVQAWAATNERIDHLETRFDRIERRLGLAEAAT